MAHRGRDWYGIRITFMLLLTVSLMMNVYLWSNARLGITVHSAGLAKTERQVSVLQDELKGKLTNSFCKVHSDWSTYVIRPRKPTKLHDWRFVEKVNCPGFDINKYPKNRQKVSLDCNSKPPRLTTSWTTSTNDIQSVPFGDKCLARVIDTCCKDNKPVPNVAHYIWYANKSLGFFQFVSFMSVLRFMKPCLILIHGNFVPYGAYWNYFVSVFPNIVHVNRTKPSAVFGHRLAFSEHASDIMRIEALKGDTQYAAVVMPPQR